MSSSILDFKSTSTHYRLALFSNLPIFIILGIQILWIIRYLLINSFNHHSLLDYRYSLLDHRSIIWLIFASLFFFVVYLLPAFGSILLLRLSSKKTKRSKLFAFLTIAYGILISAILVYWHYFAGLR